MDNLFSIELNEFHEMNSRTFGVYSHTVTPPSYFHCPAGSRLYCRLFYVVAGETIFDKGLPTEVTATAGTIVFLPEDVDYVSEWIPGVEGLYINFTFMPNDFYLTLPNCICIAAYDGDGSYLELFSKALQIWNGGAIGYKLDALSYLYKILHKLFIDSTTAQMKSSYRNIYKGILYIENNYLDEIDVGYAASLCHLSESRFRIYFKEYKNMSPITYRNFLRIKKAKELLESGEYNVTEASASVNIPDLCYFYRLFQKFYHVAPGTVMPD
ncbi:MAG: helix-turn-helix transcriptional regulator [Lachnospiraceae bacterium]|nr:helix-turn-helix transcriptional regulator [Lachnospiraceae bacterium]